MHPAMSLPRALIALALAAVLPATASGQRRLTLDDIFHPDRQRDFAPPPLEMPEWLDDSHYVVEATRDSAFVLEKVNAATGAAEPWFDGARLAGALSRLPGMTPDDARRLSSVKLSAFNRARTALVVTVGDDLYAYDLAADRLTRLSRTPGEEELATFSPDGRLVAYVRAFDLHVADVATGEEHAVTTGGSPALLNGKLDWVYQEEIYGRGNFRGFWWSPDSTHLAFLQLDESRVPEFTVVHPQPARQALETYDYPRAGDPNPLVKLGIASALGGPVVWARHDRYDDDILVVNVAWSPDGADVVYSVTDREQTWLDLNTASRSTGEISRLLRETTKTWVNELGSPAFLKDGSFLWFSERTGWQHLYHYARDGTLLRPVTSGRWDAQALHGVDEASGWVYFNGTERSFTGEDVYRIRLDGTALTRLSQVPGLHAARFSPAFTFYLDLWSDIATPPRLRAHRSDGTELRTVQEQRIPRLSEYRLGTPEFVQVPTRDGFPMEAMLIKPAGFDPARKYPVMQFTYGGPSAPMVRNAWGGLSHLYKQLLAQEGVVVWICDNRTASGKGVESTWPLYRRFGELELRDIEDGLAWLKKHPWVDAARIGIDGWSYGGFLVSYALTHSTSFAMGIAGGPVTDWRNYDSIYTERYMQTPQNNPDGYRRSSPRFAARDLHGRLLLIHGAIDDNVHVQNTLQFAEALQEAGKPFELMLYPSARHAVTDPRLVHHMHALMFDFTMRMLRPSATAAPLVPAPTAR